MLECSKSSKPHDVALASEMPRTFLKEILMFSFLLKTAPLIGRLANLIGIAEPVIDKVIKVIRNAILESIQKSLRILTVAIAVVGVLSALAIVIALTK
jgi:small-conductance mechanosensitive channel